MDREDINKLMEEVEFNHKKVIEVTASIFKTLWIENKFTNAEVTMILSNLDDLRISFFIRGLIKGGVM